MRRPPLRLTDLLENLVNLPRNTTAAEIHDLAIHGLTVNSAAVSKGDLFFALPGSRHDGRDFIDDAVARGAGAIVTDDRPFESQSVIAIPVLQAPNPRQVMAVAAARFWPQQSGMIAAVTGTNGKTSTVEFMRQIWARVNWSAASIGTIGIRGTDTHARRANIPQLTTPDSISLHETVAAIAKQGVTHLALEASSHGLQQYRLDGLNIHVAGFTNLSRDHLDHHCDMDDYFAAKARLFDEVLSEGGSAVINIDDAYGKKLVSRNQRPAGCGQNLWHQQRRGFSYQTNQHNQCRARSAACLSGQNLAHPTCTCRHLSGDERLNSRDYVPYEWPATA